MKKITLIMMSFVFWMACDMYTEIPDVRIMHPKDGDFLYCDSTTVKIYAWSGRSKITNVDIFVNGKLLGSDDEAPFEHTIANDNLSGGIYHSISAQATNDVGDVGTSEPVTVETFFQETTSIDDLNFITIQSGNYTYGSNDEIKTIDYDYGIMKYEVTNQQYANYLNEALQLDSIFVNYDVTGYYDGDEYYSAGAYEFLDLNSNYSRISYADCWFSVEEGYENHPVVEVTWFGANAFAKHYECKLPTEEEWEKAARADTGYDYPWGNEPPVCEYGAYNGAKFDDDAGCNDTGTEAVGSYYNSTSPYGLFDMAGNVWEWTDSWYSTSDRVLRGGSWLSITVSLRTWYRSSYGPVYSSGYSGFRCSRTQ